MKKIAGFMSDATIVINPSRMRTTSCKNSFSMFMENPHFLENAKTVRDRLELPVKCLYTASLEQAIDR